MSLALCEGKALEGESALLFFVLFILFNKKTYLAFSFHFLVLNIFIRHVGSNVKESSSGMNLRTNYLKKEG